MTALPARSGRTPRPNSPVTFALQPILAVLCAVSLLAGTVVPIPAAAQDSGLSGRVLDPDNRPVVGATIVATRASVARTTESGADGGFAFDGLAPGTYQLSAAAFGLAPIFWINALMLGAGGVLSRTKGQSAS